MTSDIQDIRARASRSGEAGTRARHVVILLLVGGLWGIQPALIKAATGGRLEEIEALAVTLSSVAAMVGLYLAATKRLFWPSAALCGFLAVCGTAEYAAPLVATFLVAPHIDSALIVLILSTTPVFTVALAALTGSEALTGQSLAACLLGLAGLMLLVVPEGALPSPEMLSWCIGAFVIPMCYALGSVYVSHRWPQELDAVQVSFGGTLFAGLILSPFWLPALVSGRVAEALASDHWVFLALSFALVAEMIMYFYLLQNAGAVFTSFSSFVMIVSGFIAGFLLFGEWPTPWVLASLTLLVASLALVLSRPRAPEIPS